MEIFKIQNLTFKYPESDAKALDDISFSVHSGEFVTICGKSGCGKSTLLRMLKPAIAPEGNVEGKVCFEGRAVSELNLREQSSNIGFVMQSPDNQIVTDKVWHELAFGLENLGVSNDQIRARVAEIASFFGIQNWFYKNVSELSGGQKQLLNLAAVMVMQPKVLILDEPASQLDPIASHDFLETLHKINRELGTTVILTEHRLEEAFPLSDRVIVMDRGRIIADGVPRSVARHIRCNPMFEALPCAMRVHASVDNNLECPVTVREGRQWLEKISETTVVDRRAYVHACRDMSQQAVALECKDIWFRYEKELPDVVKGLEMKIHKGEFFAIVGGNGTGKTTALSVLAGLLEPYRGKVKAYGKAVMLPQNPQTLFVKKTIELDLMDMLEGENMPPEQKRQVVLQAARLCELETLMSRHPYDLSGGEQQRAALAKVLLNNPDILLMDEPTKGIDAVYKKKLYGIIKRLTNRGISIIMVSHDVEFCARYADRCAMFFDGSFVSVGTPVQLFAGKSFYTTAANRMARNILSEAVIAEDIIAACGGEVSGNTAEEQMEDISLPYFDNNSNESKKDNIILSPLNIILGIVFLSIFGLIQVKLLDKYTDWRSIVVQISSICMMAAAVWNFVPRKFRKRSEIQVIKPNVDDKKRYLTLMSALMVVVVIPATVLVGYYCFHDKKYYFISLLIILEIMLPVLLSFESSRHTSRELVIISVLCAVTVAGRSAFYMLPQFKPVAALVILSAVCFGAEKGFLIGAVSAFVSNMFFGQGPWTPWQMLCFGIVGYVAGLIFAKGIVRISRITLTVYGGLAIMVLYGGIMNPASVIMYQPEPTREMIVSSYVMGIPYDAIHAVSTMFFLWFASEPMIEKLERVKIKYGIIK